MSDSNITRTIVPAPPGWYVARLFEGGTEEGKTWDDELIYEPIIAWEIQRNDHPYHRLAGKPHGERCIHHTVEPLTIDGNLISTSMMWAIKSPDGKWQIPLEGPYDTEAEVIRTLKHNLKQLERLEAK